jgi:hypothetical protein
MRPAIQLTVAAAVLGLLAISQADARGGEVEAGAAGSPSVRGPHIQG